MLFSECVIGQYVSYDIPVSEPIRCKRLPCPSLSFHSYMAY